jgi:hypothetical protein
VVEFKRTLGQRFKVQDPGELTNFLGMHIARTRVAMTISIHQTHCITNVLDKHGMSDCAPSIMPMDLGLMSGIASSTLTPLTDTPREVYPSLLGSL